MAEDKVQYLADHYQKTYELTYELWKERNTLFVTLLVVIGAATVLTYHVPDANSLLIALVAKTFGVADANIGQFSENFPFDILQLLLLAVIFYLMVQLYHRTAYIQRNYRYLAILENDIHEALALSSSKSFLRESAFYQDQDRFVLSNMKWVYAFILGAALALFLMTRLLQDIAAHGSPLLIIGEVVITLMTIFFFADYILVSAGKRWPPKRSQRAEAPPKAPAQADAAHGGETTPIVPTNANIAAQAETKPDMTSQMGVAKSGKRRRR